MNKHTNTQIAKQERSGSQSSPEKSERLLATQPQTTKLGEAPGKRLLLLSALLGIATFGSQLSNGANILFNPNLDNIALADQINPTPVGWTVVGVRTFSGPFFDGGDSEPWCNVSPPSDPAGYGFFFKPFQGSVGPPVDLINVDLYQDNAATPNTKFTLSGYAAGEANFCAFFSTNSPNPKALFFIEFLDGTGNGLATNVFDLVAAGLPNGGPGSMSSFQYTSPQVTAPAGTATVRAGARLLNAYNTTVNPQNFFVDSFDLESIAPPGSPDITNQPAANSIPPGGTATLTVGVSNPSGASYQWQFYNTNIANVPGSISGVDQPTLTITAFSAANVGHYRALVSNASGSVYSSDAPLAMQTLNLYPVVTLTGKKGDTYRIDYATALNPTTWIPLATNKLTTVPQTFIDTNSPLSTNRFYRSAFLY